MKIHAARTTLATILWMGTLGGRTPVRMPQQPDAAETTLMCGEPESLPLLFAHPAVPLKFGLRSHRLIPQVHTGSEQPDWNTIPDYSASKCFRTTQPHRVPA